MNKLTTEEQLFLLAYAGIPTIGGFIKKHNLPEALVKQVAPVYFCSQLVFIMKRHNEYPIGEIDKFFSNQEIINYFDSLVSSKPDDPRDINLITNLVNCFSASTDSGMETYADFLPFMSFEHDAWLQLIIRIQKGNSVEPGLKKAVELFVTEGSRLILHPELNEYEENALKTFSWFEKLEFDGKEKIIAGAMKVWKRYEEDGSYNLSGDYEENWYKDALKFSARITSKEYVSRIFAESFKDSHPEIYEKFRVLAGLEEHQVVSAPKVDVLIEKKVAEAEMQELFGQYKHEPEHLIELLTADARVKELSLVILAIATDVSDDRCKHVNKTLEVLMEKYPLCALAQELSTVFTQNLEKKIAEGTLRYEDLPPVSSYVKNKDWHWLF